MVLCELCEMPTESVGTRRCNGCWELEHRVEANPEIARLVLSRIHGKGERIMDMKAGDVERAVRHRPDVAVRVLLDGLLGSEDVLARMLFDSVIDVSEAQKWRREGAAWEQRPERARRHYRTISEGIKRRLYHRFGALPLYRISITPPEASQGDDEIIFPSRGAAMEWLDSLDNEGCYPEEVNLEVVEVAETARVTERIIGIQEGPYRRIVVVPKGAEVLTVDMKEI